MQESHKKRLRVALITGDRGIGKTTVCTKIAIDSELTGCSGLLTPAIYGTNGEKIGIKAKCISDGTAWVLASVNRCMDGPRIGLYSFSETAIARANQCLIDPLQCKDKVTIIDEIGPLELIHHQGFSPVLPLLQYAPYLLIVVRPELLDTLRPYVPLHLVRVFAVEDGNRDYIHRDIVSFFL